MLTWQLQEAEMEQLLLLEKPWEGQHQTPKRVGRDERGKYQSSSEGIQGQVIPGRVEMQESPPPVAERCSGITPAGEGGNCRKKFGGAKGWGRAPGRGKREEKGMKKDGGEQGKSWATSKRSTGPWGLL